MPMCEQDIVYGNNLVRGFSDVEANVQLRHRNDGFLGCDRITDDFQLIYFDVC
jgi:hypothetical protein